jgi:hypothetical protein
MYVIFVSQGTTGGSNSVVRLGCSPPHWLNELGAAYGLYLVELGQTVLVTDIAWVELCAGWGIISALSKNDWGFSMTPLASGLSK